MDYMTPRQVARKLGVHVETLVRWRRENRGPKFHKLSNLIRYERVEIERWLKNNEFQSTDEYTTKGHHDDD